MPLFVSAVRSWHRRCAQLAAQDPGNLIAAHLLDRLALIKRVTPVLRMLSHPCIQTSHWRTVLKALGRDHDASLSFSIRNLLACNLSRHQDLIFNLFMKAQLEMRHTTNVREIFAHWRAVRFPLTVQRVDRLPGAPVPVLSARLRWQRAIRAVVSQCVLHRVTGQTGPLVLKEMPGSHHVLLVADQGGQFARTLQDHQVHLRSMLSAPGSDADTIHHLARDLDAIETLLHTWRSAQRTWLAVQSLLAARAAAPDCADLLAEFYPLDADWRQQIMQIDQMHAALPMVNGHGPALVAFLADMDTRLQALLQRGYAQLLAPAIERCPRLAMLSPSQLLTLAEHGRDGLPPPDAAAPVLACFQDVAQLVCQSVAKSAWHVTALKGVDGTLLALPAPVPMDASAPLGAWPADLLVAMRQSMLGLLHACLLEACPHQLPPSPNIFGHLLPLVPRYPLQIALLALRVLFTTAMTTQPDRLEQYALALTLELENVARLLAVESSLTLKAFYLAFLELRDTLQTLLASDLRNVSSLSADVLQTTVADPDTLALECPAASVTMTWRHHVLPHGLEFFGNYAARLVWCPPLERVLFHLFRAASTGGVGAVMAADGASALGPETVRDLAQLTGHRLYQLTVTEAMPATRVTAHLEAVRAAGAWTVLRNVDCALAPVLRVVGEALLRWRLAAQPALLPGPGVCFATLAQTDQRALLPDTLRYLLRPVLLDLPDPVFFTQVHLQLAGFQQTGPMARALVHLLGAAGPWTQPTASLPSLCTRCVALAAQLKTQPEFSSDLGALAHAVRLLVKQHQPRRAEVLEPLLAGLQAHVHLHVPDLPPAPSSATPVLQDAIARQCDTMHVAASPHLLATVADLKLAVGALPAVALTGSAGSGKTLVRQLLLSALNENPDHLAWPEHFSEVPDVDDVLDNAADAGAAESAPMCVVQIFEQDEDTGTAPVAVTRQASDASMGDLTSTASSSVRPRSAREARLRPALLETRTVYCNALAELPDPGSTALQALLAQLRSRPAHVWQWLVLDGSLGGALADSMEALLAAVAALPVSVSVIFETTGLDHVSPAFLQLVGLVHVADDMTSWADLFHTWRTDTLGSLPNLSPGLLAWMEDVLTAWLQPLVAGPTALWPAAAPNMGRTALASVLRLLSSLLAREYGHQAAQRTEARALVPSPLLKQIVCLAHLWGLAAVTPPDQYDRLQATVRAQISERFPEMALSDADSLFHLQLAPAGPALVPLAINAQALDTVTALPGARMAAYLGQCLRDTGRPVLLTGSGSHRRTLLAQHAFANAPLVPMMAGMTADGLRRQLAPLGQARRPAGVRSRLNLARQQSTMDAQQASQSLTVFVHDIHVAAPAASADVNQPWEGLRELLDSAVARQQLLPHCARVAWTATAATAGALPARLQHHFVVLPVCVDDEQAVVDALLTLMYTRLAAVPTIDLERLQGLVEQVTRATRFWLAALPRWCPDRVWAWFGRLEQLIRDPVSLPSLWQSEASVAFPEARGALQQAVAQNFAASEAAVPPAGLAHNRLLPQLPSLTRALDLASWGDAGNPGSDSPALLRTSRQLWLALQRRVDGYKTARDQAQPLVLSPTLLRRLNGLAWFFETGQRLGVLHGPTGSGRRTLARFAAHLAGYEVFEGSLSRALRPALALAMQSTPRRRALLLLHGPLSREDVAAVVALTRHAYLPDLPDTSAARTHIARHLQMLMLVTDDEQVAWADQAESYYERYEPLPGHELATLADEWLAQQLQPLEHAMFHTPDADDEACRSPPERGSAPGPPRACAQLLAQLVPAAAPGPLTMLFETAETALRVFRWRRERLEAQIAQAAQVVERLQAAGDIARLFSAELQEQTTVVHGAEASFVACRQVLADAEAALEQLYLQKETWTQELADMTAPLADLRHEQEQRAVVVNPLLDTAQRAVAQLQPDAIEELRSYPNPPDSVVLTLKPVTVLFRMLRGQPGYPRKRAPQVPALDEPPTWDEAKMVLACEHFFRDLVAFDRDHIPDPLLTMALKLTRKKGYAVERLRQGSRACETLYHWTVAVLAYADEQRRLRPQLQRLRRLERRQARLQQLLAQSQAQEAGLREEIARCEATLGVAHGQYQHELGRLKALLQKQERASRLVANTKDLMTKCQETLAAWRAAHATLAGDSLLAASFLLSEAKPEARRATMQRWSALCQATRVAVMQPGVAVEAVLSDPEELQYWTALGLPVQHAAVLHQTLALEHAHTRWPLVYDPHGLVLRWLEQRAADHGHALLVVEGADPTLARAVEQAATNGQCLVINVAGRAPGEALLQQHPEARRLLRRVRHVDAAGRPFVPYGVRRLPWRPGFRLVLMTATPPRATPGWLLYLDFDLDAMVHEACLAATAARLQPGRHTAGAQAQAEARRRFLQRGHLQDGLISLLESLDADMFDNDALVTEVDDTVAEGQPDTARRRGSLGQMAVAYRPACQRCVQLYVQLRGLSCWWQATRPPLTAPAFADLWGLALAAVGEDAGNQAWVDTALQGLRERVHAQLRPRLTASQLLLLTVLLAAHREQVALSEWQCLVSLLPGGLLAAGERGGGGLTAEHMVKQLRKLSSVPALQACVDSASARPLVWLEYFGVAQPSLLAAAPTELAQFHKLLVWAACQPAMVPSLAHEYVLLTLGPDSLAPAPHALADELPAVLALVPQDRAGLHGLLDFVLSGGDESTAAAPRRASVEWLVPRAAAQLRAQQTVEQGGWLVVDGDAAELALPPAGLWPRSARVVLLEAEEAPGLEYRVCPPPAGDAVVTPSALQLARLCTRAWPDGQQVWLKHFHFLVRHAVEDMLARPEFGSDCMAGRLQQLRALPGTAFVPWDAAPASWQLCHAQPLDTQWAWYGFLVHLLQTPRPSEPGQVAAHRVLHANADVQQRLLGAATGLLAKFGLGQVHVVASLVAPEPGVPAVELVGLWVVGGYWDGQRVVPDARARARLPSVWLQAAAVPGAKEVRDMYAKVHLALPRAPARASEPSLFDMEAPAASFNMQQALDRAPLLGLDIIMEEEEEDADGRTSSSLQSSGLHASMHRPVSAAAVFALPESTPRAQAWCTDAGQWFHDCTIEWLQCAVCGDAALPVTLSLPLSHEPPGDVLAGLSVVACLGWQHAA